MLAQPQTNLKKIIALTTMSLLCIRHGQSQGIHGDSDNSIGVYGVSNSWFGVYGKSNTAYGLAGLSGQFHGALFRGYKDGGFADIVLAASSNTSTGDNGVIMSDPSFAGSDIFLKANDAVVVQIDNNNNNTEGNFLVWDGNNTNLFQVTHDGDVLVKGHPVKFFLVFFSHGIHGLDQQRSILL